jgi:hypothetical protein
MFLELASSLNIDQAQFTNVSVDNLVFGLIRFLFLIGFFLYFLFAFLAVRQIEEMRRTVITPLSVPIRILGYVHLLLAFFLLIFVYNYLQ